MTHSYSKLRGRGRGRGQSQELKKSRKNAADFTREREEARKREAEEKKEQVEEQHFEGKNNSLNCTGFKAFLIFWEESKALVSCFPLTLLICCFVHAGMVLTCAYAAKIFSIDH